MPRKYEVPVRASVHGLAWEWTIPVEADSAGEAIVKALAHGAHVAAAQLGRPAHEGGPDEPPATLGHEGEIPPS